MVFSSIPFLFYFLPAVVLGYFLMPNRWKNAWLLLTSLFFYGWGEPRLLLLMMVTILLFYFCGLAVERGQRKKLWLILSVGLGIGLLAVFKYAGFFVTSINAVTGLGLPLLKIALPVGISFYTFQCISYVADVYWGNPAQKSLINFAAYITMFPQLIAGPIVRYSDIALQLENRSHSWQACCDGIRRFLVGLGKKVILADGFSLLIRHFRDSGEISVVFCWMYAIAFTLCIYFDFSGYSDMAIGLGKVFGFDFRENFDYPYLSASITEFWRRWHMSLGSWFRDYVYIPLGGNRQKQIRNILVVWMLTGLWHGAGWNFVIWGLFFGVLLLAEKHLPVKKLPALVRHGYVLLAVIVSFVVFNAENFTQAAGDLAGMFGLAGLPFMTARTGYYLKSFAPLFLMGIIGATPLVKRLGSLRVVRVLEPLLLAAVLLICTAYLVDGSFSPFLYFRF